MQITNICEDLVHAISALVQSDHDLARFNQTCWRLHASSKREIERRKFLQHYSIIHVDDNLIPGYHPTRLNGKDWGPLRYIRDILAEPRIGCSVRILKLREDEAWKALQTSRIPDFLHIEVPHHIPARECDFICNSIDAFSFIGAETKRKWKCEALKGHASPLCMVLFTLCRKAKILDLSNASAQMLPYLEPLLDDFVDRRHLLRPENKADGISTYPLPPITELRINNTSINQVVKFFEIPSLRRMEACMIDEDEQRPIDLEYLAEVGARCNVEELVLAPTNVSAETLGHLIKKLPKLKRLEYATFASQWSILLPQHSGDFDLVAIEHIVSVMQSVRQLASEAMKDRQLQARLALVEEKTVKRWQFTISTM